MPILLLPQSQAAAGESPITLPTARPTRRHDRSHGPPTLLKQRWDDYAPRPRVIIIVPTGAA